MKVCEVLCPLFSVVHIIDTDNSTGEGHFDDGSNKPSGTATPIDHPEPSVPGKRKGTSKKAKTAKQRLAIADGSGA